MKSFGSIASFIWGLQPIKANPDTKFLKLFHKTFFVLKYSFISVLQYILYGRRAYLDNKELSVTITSIFNKQENYNWEKEYAI